MLDTTIEEGRNSFQSTLHVHESMLATPEVQYIGGGTTFDVKQRSSSAKEETAIENDFRVNRPIPTPQRLPEHESTSPIQIWEGTVQEVLSDGRAMRTILRAKIGTVEDHLADVSLDWVNDQDLSLVKPGAVFYLSLYKTRRRSGTIVNAEELRFRRLPAWTRRDIASVNDMAKRLIAKGKLSEDAP